MICWMLKDWTEFATNYCSDLLAKEVQKEKETNVFATMDEFDEPENDSIFMMPESMYLLGVLSSSPREQQTFLCETL